MMGLGVKLNQNMKLLVIWFCRSGPTVKTKVASHQGRMQRGIGYITNHKTPLYFLITQFISYIWCFKKFEKKFNKFFKFYVYVTYDPPKIFKDALWISNTLCIFLICFFNDFFFKFFSNLSIFFPNAIIFNFNDNVIIYHNIVWKWHLFKYCFIV